MREGQNPLRLAIRDPYPTVTLGVNIHLPTAGVYHEGREHVIRTCVESMLAGACNNDFELILYMHGCSRARVNMALSGLNLPERTTIIQRNRVESGALVQRHLCLLAPNLIAYTDDDVLFYDGWLDASLEVLRAFPGAALVTGSPILTSFRWGCGSNLEYAKKHKCYKAENIPPEWEKDFADSIGRNRDWHANYTSNDVSFTVESQGVKAWGCGHHMQFVGHPERLVPYMPERPLAYQPAARAFDEAVDSAGFLRLSTYRRYTRHMGNRWPS